MTARVSPGTSPRHSRHLPHGGSAVRGLAGHDLLGRAGPAGRDATGRCLREFSWLIMGTPHWAGNTTL